MGFYVCTLRAVHTPILTSYNWLHSNGAGRIAVKKGLETVFVSVSCIQTQMCERAFNAVMVQDWMSVSCFDCNALGDEWRARSRNLQLTRRSFKGL